MEEITQTVEAARPRPSPARPGGRLRRLRFNRPQKIAACMLAFFLLECLWVVRHQTLTDADYRYARCGREMWEKPSPLAGYFTTCGNIHDGTLAYRLAALPLTLDLRWEQLADRFRRPENRLLAGGSGASSSWEMRHQLTHVQALMRLPFLLAGLALGGALWWVTRRLFGDRGGYTATAFYCVSPQAIHYSTTTNNEILTALALFGGLYTAIGVAHAMQGPPHKWRPRILLLTLLFGGLAAAHIAALPLALLLALLLMGYLAEGRSSAVLPVLLLVAAGALLLLFASYTFSPDAFSYVFRSNAGMLRFSAQPARLYFGDLRHAGTTLALLAALAYYLRVRRARYFGNSVPLFLGCMFFLLVTAGIAGNPAFWALPFLLAFLGGVFADAYEGAHGRGWAAAAACLAALEAALCLLALPALSA